MNGVLLAADFSWGCKRADDLEISQKLKKYAHSRGKSHPEEEIREELKKLFSYIYYRVIAVANNISDPFDIRVVKAHWIGSELLDNVQPVHIKAVFEEELEKNQDKVILARIFEPLVKNLSVHHNNCAMSEQCRVRVENGYFYHLGIKRLKAEPQDLENFAKYGRG